MMDTFRIARNFVTLKNSRVRKLTVFFFFFIAFMRLCLSTDRIVYVGCVPQCIYTTNTFLMHSPPPSLPPAPFPFWLGVSCTRHGREGSRVFIGYLRYEGQEGRLLRLSTGHIKSTRRRRSSGQNVRIDIDELLVRRISRPYI